MVCISRSMKHYCLVLLGILAGAALVLSACGIQPASTPAPVLPVEVDPRFREFYLKLGGQTVIGDPLGPSFEVEGVLKQSTDKVLMVFNPAAPRELQYYLDPLGRRLNLPEPSREIPQEGNESVVDGIVIYKKFYPLYERFGLTKYAGRPLSQPEVDADNHRIVQYFENVGFYTLQEDPNETVYLVDYGRLFCELGCLAQGQINATPKQPMYFPEPFLDSLKRVGSDLPGKPLTGYYRALDGNIEQVYENVIVYAPRGDILGIQFRPLPALIGIGEGPLVPEEVDPFLVFMPFDKHLGHNVPTVFQEYILSHGGFDLAGKPISERFTVGSVYRQCFTNYCLDFDPQSPAGVSPIRPSPLGNQYVNLYPDRSQAESSVTLAAKDVLLKVWEKLPRIASTEKQTINVMVKQSKDEAPIQNLAVRLTVSLPDGSTGIYVLPPTGTDGATSYTLPPILAENGRLVPYKVCLMASSSPQICIEDSFIIWNNP